MEWNGTCQVSFDHQCQAATGPGPVPANGQHRIGGRASWDTSVGGGVSVGAGGGEAACGP